MSLDLIPLEIYTPILYYVLALIVIINYLRLQNGFVINKTGILLVFFLIAYMGLRPISGFYFGDMANYYRFFESYQQGEPITQTDDLFFHYFTKLCSAIMNANFYFLVCALLYIYPLFLVSKKWLKAYWYYAFLLIVSSFSFWAYGTNGIRNGIAGSIFLLAVSRDKRVWQSILLFVAINFHKTMLLPTMGFVIAQFYNKPKHFMWFWVLCIPLSFIGGGVWESLFASIGFGDDRLSYLTEGNVNDDKFSGTGFRWDFLIYSATAVYAGWYFIVKKKFNDKIYNNLFITYLFANAFWILVIRANFSNRFAYLSWFMMAVIIAYPFLRSNLIKNQSKSFAKVLLLYFLFTFFMNVIL